MRKELKVSAIQNGTVIDHITCGMALKVLSILGIRDTSPTSTVSVSRPERSTRPGSAPVWTPSRTISTPPTQTWPMPVASA